MPAIALVGAAVEMIERTQATMRIEELMRRIGLSQSALERRFRRLVGASPRRFASLVRVVRLREALPFASSVPSSRPSRCRSW